MQLSQASTCGYVVKEQNILIIYFSMIAFITGWQNNFLREVLLAVLPEALKHLEMVLACCLIFVFLYFGLDSKRRSRRPWNCHVEFYQVGI